MRVPMLGKMQTPPARTPSPRNEPSQQTRDTQLTKAASLSPPPTYGERGTQRIIEQRQGRHSSCFHAAAARLPAP